jgi:UrcA family protein
MTSTNFHFNSIRLNSIRGRRAGLAMIAGCLAVAAAGTATAATPPPDVPSVVVRYADLDISTPQGASSLYRRIAIAARKVCPVADISELGRFMEARACQEQAIARAVQAVSNPQLAAVYAAHGRHS